MAELTFKSPGVSTREIDLSGPTTISPRGIPAGVVGTAVRGPAFVPITFATFQDFVANFGNTDGTKFGPLAVNEWMKNATAGTYVRVLGIGNGLQRGSSDGLVTNSGFTVGEQLPQQNGNIGTNSKAYNPFLHHQLYHYDKPSSFLGHYQHELRQLVQYEPLQ